MSIVTISHQMGSEGPEIAQALADCLGYRFVGSEQLLESVAAYGLAADKLTHLGETKPSFFERFSRETRLYLVVIQTALYEPAEGDNVVILGRGGQWLLRGIRHALTVRIMAPFDTRVRRVSLKVTDQAQAANPAAVRELVRRDDMEKAGRAHYLYAADLNDPALYSLIVNTEVIEVDAAVEAIAFLVRRPEVATTAERAASLRSHSGLTGPGGPDGGR